MKIWLGAALLLALGLRALGFEWVFVDSDTVVFAPGDAQYHVRRALYSWVNFPTVLFSDPYINYPGGAAISWPPLFDFTTAALGRLLAGDPHRFEVFAAWVPPVVGAFTLLPVYALACRIGGAGVGVGAAALLALLPIHLTYSRIGEFDHHCVVALIGACLLWVVARLVAEDGSSARLGAGLTAGRLAMLLTWHGSLLYLALIEAILWLAAAVGGRRDLYRVQAVSAFATCVVLAPLVWLFPEPLGGPWSAIALSRLHVLAVVLVAIVSAGMWKLEGFGRPRHALARLGWSAGFSLTAVGLALLVPAIREGVEPALRFLTMSDGVGLRTGEQLPLFAVFGRATGRPVWLVWGLLGYLIPVLPLLVVWACPKERRAMAWVVAAWCFWFGVLALVQRRYGNDLAPAAAVGFAIVIAAVGRRLAAWAGGSRLVVVSACVGIGLVVLAPPIALQLAPRFGSSFRAWRGEPATRDRALLTVSGSITRFMQRVRRVTPETSGYFDTRQAPEFGVVAHANLGHAIQNVARLPTPTDPFWAFIGVENWNAAFQLLGAASESRAVYLARRLNARYVLTFSSADPATLEGWLHHADGTAAVHFAASKYFRLVAEGPERGVHLASSFQLHGQRVTGPATLPYKLFERVEGAVLEVRATAGESVIVTLRLASPAGRRIDYEANAIAGADGVARLRVPYATGPPLHAEAVAPEGPYRVRLGGGVRAVAVSEADVQEGRVVVVSDS
ncbi:MAG: hypothetical protein VX466_08730 [Myxococcota bacterium]|nr:hypothetical protein [Myxococcota bacterium]